MVNIRKNVKRVLIVFNLSIKSTVKDFLKELLFYINIVLYSLTNNFFPEQISILLNEFY